MRQCKKSLNPNKHNGFSDFFFEQLSKMGIYIDISYLCLLEVGSKLDFKEKKQGIDDRYFLFLCFHKKCIKITGLALSKWFQKDIM